MVSPRCRDFVIAESLGWPTLNLETLTQTDSKLKAVSEHADYILALAKPCANITLADETGTDAGSRFGGPPSCPPTLLGRPMTLANTDSSVKSTSPK
ncbi:hypothetical protein CA85_13550 [Allorhodopirellula solitaria]|uniref:Uncharacterized protein n=1 Tax=Allorhodopirellula solitaria TaxID=2527987 RepID=A0A5C5YCS2_9BACT|nr:hypothetical protein CA85_13550 [Allorhodopirellula solitaria]